jgi:hypothetical protein
MSSLLHTAGAPPAVIGHFKSVFELLVARTASFPHEAHLAVLTFRPIPGSLPRQLRPTCLHRLVLSNFTPERAGDIIICVLLAFAWADLAPLPAALHVLSDQVRAEIESSRISLTPGRVMFIIQALKSVKGAAAMSSTTLGHLERVYTSAEGQVLFSDSLLALTPKIIAAARGPTAKYLHECLVLIQTCLPKLRAHDVKVLTLSLIGVLLFSGQLYLVGPPSVSVPGLLLPVSAFARPMTDESVWF